MNLFKYFFLLVFMFFGCDSLKGQIQSDDIIEIAIQNAISDFSNTKIYNRGRVFKIIIESSDDCIIRIDIGEDEENKYLYSTSKPAGENILPSRYKEKDNKLFIWWDDNQKVNQAMFDILKKYDMLKDDEGGWINYIDAVMDDRKKGVNYFFCKRNLKEYKRIITNIGNIKYPKLNCSCIDYQIHAHPR